MDVDMDKWYKSSRTYQSHIEADMGVAQKMYDSVRYACGKIGNMGVEILPVAEFLDLTVAPRLPAIPTEFKDRKFAFIGEWYSEQRDWKFCLAIPLPHENPFCPPLEPVVNLIVTYMFPRQTPDDIRIEAASIQVSLVEPETVRTVKGFTPRVEHIAFVSNQKFSETENAQTFDLYLSDFLSILGLFSRFEHQEFFIRIETEYTIHVERRPDLSRCFETVLLVDVILDQVVTKLSLHDVANLGAASHSIRDKLLGLPRRRLHTLLAKYFSTPSKFAACLRRTGAVVGGSGILSILCPGYWEPGDLDIVVTNSSRDGVIAFLESEGFAQEAAREDDPGYSEDDRIHFGYRRFLKEMPHGPRRIDLCVVRTKGDYALTPGTFVLTYHSTPVMNLYNGHGIFCLFPLLTFNGILMRNRFTPTDRIEHGVAKYVARGFRELEPGTYIQDKIPGDVGQLRVDMLHPIWYQKIEL